MKKNIGIYDESLKNLFNSFKKRFGLKYDKSIAYVDDILEDKSYSVLYFTSDVTYTKELIDEINSKGVGQAYGFYKGSYDNIDDIKKGVPKIIGEGGNKFVVVEIQDKSRFRLEEIPKNVFVKLCRNRGEIVVDIVKSREYIMNENIHKLEKNDMEAFNILYKNLYAKRRMVRTDLFMSNYKMSKNQMGVICNGSSDEGVFVCYRDEKMVGFIVFENVVDKTNTGIENNYNIYIKDIFVLEEYRRLGIATRLFGEVCRFADRYRFKCVRFRNWGFDYEVEKFINSLNKKVLYTTYEIEL